ncbi:hypothetical protein A3D88_00880 [Candidatus Peribacteria bacterium RIFCSPHIGHO2_02_FULL_52_16]|nr:MAG: hypothetical protein A2706_05525 [Candidatus Peribacteria bacterium RIFCSPHIGHO2_01_FULL_51_35]OGJ61221.1 MAG: hypothetical protein A3D88_00880 [Candidatus Peribacteria bacterium RIFCSPHIGHO2_02_FULL_52_16]
MNDNSRGQTGAAGREASQGFLQEPDGNERNGIVSAHSIDVREKCLKFVSSDEAEQPPLIPSDREWGEGEEERPYNQRLLTDDHIAGILSTAEHKRTRNLLERLLKQPVLISIVRNNKPIDGFKSSPLHKTLLAFGLVLQEKKRKTKKLFLKITDRGRGVLERLKQKKEKAAAIKVEQKIKKPIKFPKQRIERIVEQILKNFPPSKGVKMKIRGALIWWGVQLAEEMPDDMPDREKEEMLVENFSSVAMHNYRDVEVMHSGPEEES